MGSTKEKISGKRLMRMRTVTSAPSAPFLIESLRDLGYSLETALADIIDNSITAGARNVRILAEVSQTGGRIAVIDDGSGMCADSLVNAMRLGSRDPLQAREARDLGRFGLGLKTASFSQCRKLTVWTQSNGVRSGARWDLDHVSRTKDWSLQVLEEDHPESIWNEIGEVGTAVVWESLDRLVEPGDTAKSVREFTRRIDEARSHLELVFHRFLHGEGQSIPKVAMTLNGTPLVPMDPFHSGHPSTQREPMDPETIRIFDKSMTLQTFTLPHHSKVSASEWERYGLSEGYLKSQGCYVYRGGD